MYEQILKFNGIGGCYQILHFFQNKFVPYDGTVILELRSFDNEYYVQVFYKNSEKTPHPIKIPGCGTVCPLSKLYEICGNILPKNGYDIECQINE